MSILELKNISRQYGTGKNGKMALRDFSMNVEKGDFVGIMGPSGAGKTTLMNIIATIDSASSGTVAYNGRDISVLKKNQLADFRKENIGFVFQDSNLLETLTIRENIALPLALKKMSPVEIRGRIDKTSAILGIGDILDKYPQDNSGGQRQRGAVARAIAGDSGLILADEPTGALDSANSRELMNCFSELCRVHKRTIVLVTHDPLVASYCKRIVFLKDGSHFSEINCSGTRNAFYNEIIAMLSALEGEIEGDLL